ncbi:flippase [Photobacterium damselae subsp. damselae]|uniref:oligosaccharide flippase family protein n=1 Tax=Photobacterium damselae TaxID=38293 RepID=UPI000D060555|nr:oligosaccharide flippase family protein [Photobacterium damselae]PSB83907.1 flippase [Photobacterium damselae subsp. damselae]
MTSMKKVINNIFNISAIELLGLLIPIVTMPILTRSLGADLYGGYLLFTAVMIFGQTIIDYGVQYTGVRDAARANNNEIKLKDIFQRYQGVRAFFFVVYLIVIIVYSQLLSDDSSSYYILHYGTIYLLGYFLCCSWFYQAISETRRLMIAMVIPKLINLLVVVIFIRDQNDIEILYLVTSCTVLMTGLYLSLYLFYTRGYDLFRVGMLKNDILSGFDVFIGILAPNLYNALPTIIMGSLYNSSQFALFAIASRICSIISMLQGVLSKAIYPFLSSSKVSYLKEIIIANIIISAPLVLILYFFSNELLSFFFGDDFSENLYLKVMLIGMFFYSISNSIVIGFILPMKFDNVYKKISLIVSFISAGVAIVMIYNFGLLGGAVTLTIARTLYFIFYSLFYFKNRSV